MNKYQHYPGSAYFEKTNQHCSVLVPLEPMDHHHPAAERNYWQSLRFTVGIDCEVGIDNSGAFLAVSIVCTFSCRSLIWSTTTFIVSVRIDRSLLLSYIVSFKLWAYCSVSLCFLAAIRWFDCNIRHRVLSLLFEQKLHSEALQLYFQFRCTRDTNCLYNLHL